MEKKLIKRKIRTSKTNFVLQKNERKCLSKREKGFTQSLKLLQGHSAWFHTVNYIHDLVVFSTNAGLTKEIMQTTEGWNNHMSWTDQPPKPSHTTPKGTPPEFYILTTILYNRFDRIGNPSVRNPHCDKKNHFGQVAAGHKWCERRWQIQSLF